MVSWSSWLIASGVRMNPSTSGRVELSLSGASPTGCRALHGARNNPTFRLLRTYWTELATDEKTLLALEPTNRIVPTTITRITANITAYSAISWASSPTQAFQRTLAIFHLPWGTRERLAIQEGWGTAGENQWSVSAKGAGLHPKLHRRLCTLLNGLSSLSLILARQPSTSPKGASNRTFGQQRPPPRRHETRFWS